MGPPSRRRPQPDPFEPFYREHLRFVVSLVRRCGVREADVHDVVQEVFIVLHRALLAGLDTSYPLRGWLRRTCFRKVRDHRKRPREREQPARAGAIELADVADVGPTPEEVIMEISAWANVDAVLDHLPQEQRLVFVMSEIEEMPGREIAEVLEIPEGTVASRLASARRSARRIWEERRASGLRAVVPFALWDLDSLLEHSAAPPPLPPGFEDEVWRRLTQSIPGLAAGGAAAAAGTAAAVKAGAVLTAKQAAVGFVFSAIVGAGLHAAVRPTMDAGESEKAASTSAAIPARSAATAPASATTAAPVVVVAPVGSASFGAASASASASTSSSASSAPDSEAADRVLLDKAHTMIAREDYTGARAALLRIKSARFAGDRERLLRDVAAHLDGGR